MAQPAPADAVRTNVGAEETGRARSAPADRASQLRDLLQARGGERHIVAIQDYPDPDAISSALAYRTMATCFDIEADIVYEGLISHPENLALVNLLEIELKRFDGDLPLERYDAAVFIDNQGTTTRLTSRLREAGIPTLVVIDHHDPQDVLDPIFRDVRPVGAAATQLTEYLASGAFFELDSGNNEHVELATALLHGLHSETASFIHAQKSEYDAAAYLSRVADRDLLERVLCVQKSRGTMETIHAALGRRILRGGLSLAGVGYLRWADRDAIPQAADFLLKEENVKTAVVYGIVAGRDGRESIIGSLRTTDATLAVDSFLKTALGRNTAGRHYGGGRSRAGGFEIELDFLAGGTADTDERETKWELFDRQIRRKLFEAAGLEKPKGEEVEASE
ncbi:MAG: bifunctional oligoribonuclease/PAP phosphatase NrnA [Gemmatimonadota bacterium]